MATGQAADGEARLLATVGRIETLFAPVDALVDEARVHLDESGIRITVVDPANVGMVDVDVGPRAFEAIDTGGEYTIGLALERFLDLVGMGDSGDMVEIAFDPDERTLSLRVAGTIQATLATIDPDAIRQEPDLPDDLATDGHARLAAGQLAHGVDAAALMDDHIHFAVAPDAVTISAEGDTDDVSVTYPAADLERCETEDGERYASLFSLDYIGDMVGAIPDDDLPVALDVGNRLPVRMQYVLADGAVRVENLCAPRVDAGGGG